MKVEELEGARLDYWVAMAGEEWKTAHHFYPTMTLDPRFSGVELRDFSRGAFGVSELACVLVPSNSFRQDPQPFMPSTEWEHGGPLIERHRIELVPTGGVLWRARAWKSTEWLYGATPLIAAMRAHVANRFGAKIEDA
jgi:hypothetical protein